MSSQGIPGSNNQAFPQIGAPFVELPSGNLARPWYRLLISLWRKAGGGFIATQLAAYLQLDEKSFGVPVQIRRASDGVLLGDIPLVNHEGGPARPVAVGASPFVYEAPLDGTVVVFAAEVELSRDGAVWWKVTLQGGAIPVLIKDRIRVTWFGDQLPEVTFFPIQ